MKNTDIDNVVRKHKAILGLPQGFGKKPVAEKIKILNTKARSKNVALKGFVSDYNKLKEAQGAGSKVGGKGGKGGATKTGKMVKDLKKPITEKKGMKAKPKPPAPKPKPAPKKPEPSIDEEIKKLSQAADKEIAKKKAEKKAKTAERVKEKPKPRGPRPGKVKDISKMKPKEGVASGGMPVPTITESKKADSNVFNLQPSNLISDDVPEGVPIDDDEDYYMESPGYVPADSDYPSLSQFMDEIALGAPLTPDNYEPPTSFFKPKPVKKAKPSDGPPKVKKGQTLIKATGEIIDDATGATIYRRKTMAERASDRVAQYYAQRGGGALY